MNKIETRNFVRINKTEARGRYNRGEKIYVCPCKMDPENKWQKAVLLSMQTTDGEKFDNAVNYFEYYNCQYNELGKYAAFYKEA